MQGKQTRKDNRFSLRAGGCLTCGWIIPVLLVVFGYLGLRAAGAFLITGDPLRKADAVVVLGGGDVTRVHQGVRLVVAGYAGSLILTEPGELEPGAGPASRILRSEAIASGLTPSAILITPKVSSSTAEEALAVRELMAEKGFHSVIVVTEPYHTKRTRLIFQRAFASSDLSVWVYPVQNHWYRSGTWFLHAEGWGHTVREYVKLGELLLRVLF